MSKQPRAKKKRSMIIWAILGLLVISLTGFGVRSIGHSGTQTIGSVGDENVTVDTYVRALNNQLRALSQQVGQNITLEQARAFGLDQQVLAQVLETATLDGETSRLGLSIGDQRVLENLLSTDAFKSLSGAFDESAYNYALQRANMSPAEYDGIVRKQSSRALLQASVVGGIVTNDSYGIALLDFVAEERSFLWVSIGEDMLPDPTRQPTASELDTYYRANPDRYTAPETRKITYVHLTPEMLFGRIDVDEAALLDLYDTQSDRFSQPERRIVDRVVFGTQDEARAALDQITSGSATFEDIVTARGLSIEDVGMGEIARGDLSGAADEALFARNEPGVVGPIDSALGPALFQINAVLDGHTTSFEDARKVLLAEYFADAARRRIDGDITNIDDLLAGGATIEDVAAETDMELAKIDYVTGDEDGMAAYEEFRTAVEAAAKGDFPQVETLSDGGIFALRLNKIVEPTLLPLVKVSERVTTDWQAQETRNRVIALANDLKSRMASGESFADLQLTPRPEEKIRRESFIENAPVSLVSEIFKLGFGDLVVVEGQSEVAIAQMTGVTAFDEKSFDSTTVLATVRQQYAQQIGNDVLIAFSNALQEDAGITVNQRLITAVHAQIP